MKTKIKLIIVVLFSCVMLTSCSSKMEADYVYLMRDPAKTGGHDLSYEYDINSRTAMFGGEDEIINYYAEDLVLGRTAGCRVGVKITPPLQIEDFSGATLSFNGKIYDSTQMFESDNHNIYIYPLVSEERMENTIKIIWNRDTKEQTYKIVIKDGTKFDKTENSSNSLKISSKTNIFKHNYS